jgi:hypothetical protein
VLVAIFVFVVSDYLLTSPRTTFCLSSLLARKMLPFVPLLWVLGPDHGVAGALRVLPHAAVCYR